MKTKDLGKFAEEVALDFFMKKDFRLLARNFRVGRAEIDLILAHEKMIVFVEVKYRKNNQFGYPEDFVSEAQKERIRFAAEIFLEKNNFEFSPKIRFDILAIDSENPKMHIEHFEDAF